MEDAARDEVAVRGFEGRVAEGAVVGVAVGGDGEGGGWAVWCCWCWCWC